MSPNLSEFSLEATTPTNLFGSIVPPNQPGAEQEIFSLVPLAPPKTAPKAEQQVLYFLVPVEAKYLLVSVDPNKAGFEDENRKRAYIESLPALLGDMTARFVAFDKACEWFYTSPIPAMGYATPADIVRDGDAQYLVKYFDRCDAGDYA